ncbi:MAG: ABC transporter permease [Candidatus Azobacteroides sp.]|nr:ABC transporter permease [Candidatus Azobacteroides sp.]
MNMMLETRLLFKRKMLETLREPVWIVAGLSTPLLYLILFAPLLKGLNAQALNADRVIDVFVPGMLALFAFGTGTGEGWTVVWEVQNGVIERLRVTPASRLSFLLGPVLRDIVMFIVPSLIVIAVSTLFGFHVHFSGLFVLMILLSLLTAVVSATSISLGLILKDSGSLAAVVTGLQLPVTLLAGVLLPLDLGPEWLQIIAHFNPLYYVVNATRVLSEGIIFDGEVYLAFAVMIGLCIIVFSWATRVYRKVVA